MSLQTTCPDPARAPGHTHYSLVTTQGRRVHMATNRVPYRISLRVLGRLLNGDKARMVTVCEIEQGFLLHYFQRGEPQCVVSRAIHTAEVMDLDDLLRKQRGKPAPSGSLKGLHSIFGLRPDEALRFQ